LLLAEEGMSTAALRDDMQRLRNVAVLRVD